MDFVANGSKNVEIETSTGVYLRHAIQTHFVEIGEDYIELVNRYVKPLYEEGDLLSISEKIIALCQKRVVYRKDMKISWLAKFNPFAMVLTSFLVVFVQKGAAEVSTYARLGASFPSMLAGVFFFFIIASEFFINYKIMFNKKYFKIPACFKKKKQAEVVAEEDK